MHAETLCPGRIYIHERTVQTWRFHSIEVDHSQRESLVFSPFPPASAGSILYTNASGQFVTRLVPWENNEAGVTYPGISPTRRSCLRIERGLPSPWLLDSLAWYPSRLHERCLPSA